jgi:hypothetical protein
MQASEINAEGQQLQSKEAPVTKPKSYYSVESNGTNDGVYTVTDASSKCSGGSTKQKDKEKKKENPKKTTEKVRVRSKNDQGKEKEVERVVYVGPRGGKYIKNKDGSFSRIKKVKDKEKKDKKVIKEKSSISTKEKKQTKRMKGGGE